jgi:hypothetical protein
MTKYLVSAAVGAVIAAGAFTAPASAQGISLSIGEQRPYYGYGYQQPRYYNHGPAVRVYSGRSSYRNDDCYMKRTVKWRNGKKIVRETEVCR